MVGSGVVGIGSAADDGRVAGVQTWRAPSWSTFSGEGGAGGGLGVFVPSCHFLSKFEIILKYIIF